MSCYPGVKVRRGMTMKQAASLLGGWRTDHPYKSVRDYDVVVGKTGRDRSWAFINLLVHILDEHGWTRKEEKQVHKILEKIFDYDNAIAKRERASLPMLKGDGLKECAKILKLDINTRNGYREALKLWNSLRQKIHRGPILPRYPYDAPERRVRLDDPAVPWIGTYYSYPRVNTGAAVREYLKNNPPLPEVEGEIDSEDSESSYSGWVFRPEGEDAEVVVDPSEYDDDDEEITY